MTSPVGLLLDGDQVRDIYASLIIETPESSPSCALLPLLQRWNGTLDLLSRASEAELVFRAELLVSALDAEGWCLSDLASGEVRALRSSDAETLFWAAFGDDPDVLAD